MPPLRIAEALAASLRACRTVPPASRSASRHRASSTCVCGSFLEGVLDEAVRGGRDVRPGDSRAGHARQRRVRVGQPDGSTHGRERARCLRRRPPEPGARGGRSSRDARVLLQRLGPPGPRPRCVGCGAPSGRGAPRGGLPGRLRGRPRARLPADVWEAATAAGADRDGVLGAWAGGRPRRHRGQPGAPGRPLRRLEERGEPARGRLGGPRRRAAPRGRSCLRGGRRDLVPLDDVRRRQGPRRLPLVR